MLFDAAKLLQLFEIYKSFLYFFKKILIICIFILRLCIFVIAPSKKTHKEQSVSLFHPIVGVFSTATVHLSPQQITHILSSHHSFILRSSSLYLACIQLVSSLFASTMKARCKLDEWRMRGGCVERVWKKNGG